MHGKYGVLTAKFGWNNVTVEVCHSNAGYYLGTMDDDGPIARESVEYWKNKSDAEEALVNGNWTQREES